MRAPVRFGRYTLGRVLGEGWQGRVHEAVLHGPDELERAVAVKILARAEGLVQEAWLGGLLRHPHLVDVFEVGEVGGVAFLAMELCDAGSLAGRAPLPPRAVVEVGLQVASALQYAHEELGLVHLDLKPHNLLLHRGTVKVADLGVAVARGFERRAIAGTVGYMAPEQAAGGPIDVRCDVYALGVTLHELATGARPGSAVTFSPDEDEPSGELGSGPAWLAELVARCTDSEPGARYASMAELREALRALVVEGPGLAEVSPRADREAGVAPVGPIGRDDLADALAARLDRPGLVTLWGPAGIGKSCLAADATARRRAAGWPTRWCDLSEVRTRAELLGAVAASLPLPLFDGDEGALAAQLGRALRARGPLVVVLDGIDLAVRHAPLLRGWCRSAPQLRLVATSRQTLGVEGEEVMEVPPLSEVDALAVFVRHARARGVEVRVGEPERELARRLDGIPLALELAAGRLGVLSTSDLLARLGTSMLRSGEADLPERRSTLRGALDWTGALLDAPTHTALSELSVFRGAFTPQAAHAVLGAGPSSAAALAALRDRSLVVARGDRLRMLEPVRAWAAERLASRAEVEARHAAWFARAGSDEAVERAARSDGASEDLDDRLAAARAVDPDVAVAALRGAWSILRTRGPLRIAADAGEELLLRPELVGPARARLLHLLGTVAVTVGELPLAAERLEAAILAWREVGDRGREATTLDALGNLRRTEGRLDDARAAGEAALATSRELGDRGLEAAALAHLGLLASDQGDPARALPLHQAALALHRERGDRRSEAAVLVNLGIAHAQRGDLAASRGANEGALGLARILGDRWLEGMTLGNLALVEIRDGHPGRGSELLEQALILHRELGNRRSEAIGLSNLARLLHELGRPDEALVRFEEALPLLRELGDRPFEALTLGNLGALLAELGRLDEGIASLEQAATLHREAGQRAREATVLGALGRALAARGDLERAEATLAEAVVALRVTGPVRNLAVALATVAEVAATREDAVAFDAALGELDGLSRATPDPASLDEALGRVRGLVRPRR